MSNLTVYQEPKETTDQRRRRLATEMNLIKSQFNAKVAELLDEGLDVDLVLQNGLIVSGEDALVVAVDVSYQTKRKYYR